MKNHMDFEYIRLIHEIFSENTDGYSHRGFVILNQNGIHITSRKVTLVILSEKIVHFFEPPVTYLIHQYTNNCICYQFLANEKKHPLWFVFSGMGSQWPAMGVPLMKLPTFAESIRKSHEILDSKRVNLMKIITSDDPQIIKNVLNSCVGIVAIQVSFLPIMYLKYWIHHIE